MRLRASIIGVAVVLACLAGCGGEHATSSSSTSTAPAQTSRQDDGPQSGDQALVQRALITADDLSAPWREESEKAPELGCSARPFRRARARAATNRLELDDTEIQLSVASFGTLAASREGFARLNGSRALACLRRNVRRRMTERGEGEASRPVLIRGEDLGGWGTAFRYSATVPSQLGLVDGLIDAVHARVGRGVGALVVVASPRPLDIEDYEDVLAALKRRMDEAFG